MTLVIGQENEGYMSESMECECLEFRHMTESSSGLATQIKSK